MGSNTITVISEAEYLGSMFEPDCEFEDGVVIERNFGDRDHSWLQAALGAYIFHRRNAWNIEAFTELRHRTRPGKYLIPDICVIHRPRPADKVFSKPPLIWIEILSPEDRPLRVNEKVRQVLEFGAPNVWVIDPETLDAEMHTASGSRKATDGILRLEGSPIEVPLRGLEE